MIKKTRHINNEIYPEFNEWLNMPVMIPTMSKYIKIFLYDQDKIGSDQKVACYNLDFNDIQETPEKYSNPFWINF